MQRSAMQFSRINNPVDEMEIWSASGDEFSFVISHESRGGPGLHGAPGFLASWRPLRDNKGAVKVIGSPFKTFEAAEQACETMLGYLKETE